ncbi:BAM_G0006050.mRNA.1.CDS.1 [Saccharomyces cerevisiae]|nr:BAM_G0006050.mRNA.1.CDS.1 [Saccharomyces cerevisiae]CAI7056016.1 BAM_G0006050.mRNA.1.CDS.1 [Saccharomyces cerevisiae]
MDDICKLCLTFSGTEIDEINLNTNNLYNSNINYKNTSNNVLENTTKLKEKSPKGKSSNHPKHGHFRTGFRRKQSLNSKEKEEVAKKCGITPLQVRVWVCNMRIKLKYILY